MARILDIVFSIFFLIQIPIIMLLDSQSVIPPKFVPKQNFQLFCGYNIMMLVSGLPTMLECIFDNILEESQLVSYKIAGNQECTTLILRFVANNAMNLVHLRDWYSNTFRDVLMKETPLWMQTFVYCELLFQLPFCFVAAYGYFKGAEKCKWLRIPSIIYGSHYATVMFSAITYIMFQDFSQVKHPAPRNMEERLTLAAVYAMYAIMLAAIVLDAVFSSAYSASKKKNMNSQNAPRQNVPKGRSRKKKAQ